jgi:hypothetical protein
MMMNEGSSHCIFVVLDECLIIVILRVKTKVIYESQRINQMRMEKVARKLHQKISSDFIIKKLNRNRYK